MNSPGHTCLSDKAGAVQYPVRKIRVLSAFAMALLLFVGGCAGDTTDTNPPEPDNTAVPPATGATATAAGEGDSTVGDTTTTTRSATLDTPAETTTTMVATPDPATTTTETEAPDDTTTTTAVEAPEAPENTTTTTEAGERTVVPDPSVQVEPEGETASTSPDTEVVYWRPGMDKEAFASVDPETETADYWEIREWEMLGVSEPRRYYMFHYYDSTDPNAERKYKDLFTGAVRHAIEAFHGEYFWYPYRYDVSWGADTDTITVTGTYPLGEQVSVTVGTDLATRRKVESEHLPLPPPPIRPTTPFAEPSWPDTADRLGRDCPPVEQVWTGKGTEVTDKCTLKAVQAAVALMWKGNVEKRQRAIRDGHVLVEFLEEIDNMDNAYYRAIWGEVSRRNGWTYIRNVEWAGNWPGASMIYLEWNLRRPQRAFTAEENEARLEHFNTLVEQGLLIRDKYLSEDLTLGETFDAWEPALIVRTADGTWRMSYRSFCWWHETARFTHREPPRCPADPTPHFPDSAFFDTGIYPPNHSFYYQDPRYSFENRSHREQGTPRMSDEYLGVPPS